MRKGLTDEQVLKNREKFGSNTFTPLKKDSAFKKFLLRMSGPFGHKVKNANGEPSQDGDALIFILEIAGVLSLAISIYEYCYVSHNYTHFFEPIGIFVAIFLAVGIAFILECRAEKEFEVLNATDQEELVKVIRNTQVVLVQKRDIVVGDIVMLSTGDEVPADGLVLEATLLQVDESTLTGEPFCDKSVENDESTKAAYPTNKLLRSSKVVQGHAVMEVTAVGDATEYGKVYKEAQIDNSIVTPLNEQLNALSKFITLASYIIAAAIVVFRLANYFHSIWGLTLLVPTIIFFYLLIKKFPKWKISYCVIAILLFLSVLVGMAIGLNHYCMPNGDLLPLISFTLQTIMIAVALIVVAVPEGLPMAVTLSLAYSMRAMLKTGNLVRRMHACETMGATTVICTDKTGTLTQNKMSVEKCAFYIDDNNLLYNNIAINSTAELNTTQKEPIVVGNPTEGALLLYLLNQGVYYKQLRESATILAEIPFSTITKYMGVVAKIEGQSKRLLFLKGAPEIVIGLCNRCKVEKNEVFENLKLYQQAAYRTLAFAYTYLDDDFDITDIDKKLADIETLELMGIAAISDPIREDVRDAVLASHSAGIDVKIITGDNSDTAKEIGRQIGIWTELDGDENIAVGEQIAQMSDEQLEQCVAKLKIIARARPSDKRRIVKALQSLGHVVAVTGDGTNDAPALNMANVGLSMGAGTAVAKEASDITITDNSFSTITSAVMWGRSLYQNIQRFLLFQLTVNVSACLVVLLGALRGIESPLTVTQMLWVNLIMDSFAAMALASLPPNKSVMTVPPRKKGESILSKSLMKNIFGVGVGLFVILSIFLFIFAHLNVESLLELPSQLKETFSNANGVHEFFISPAEMTSYEKTLFFSLFVWTHFFYMFCARAFATGKSVFRCRYSNGFIIISIVIVLGQLIITELMPNFFNVEPFFDLDNHHDLNDLVMIVIFSSIVIWVREIYLLFIKKPKHAIKN